MKKLGLIFVLILSIFCIRQVKSYDVKISHPILTESAINIYNQKTNNKKITNLQRGLIVQGSIEEDNTPKYLNHFYNPKLNKGLTCKFSQFLCNNAKDWAINGRLNNYSVSDILSNYRNGLTGRAFMGVGHILHLVEDMTVPAHTRLDPHGLGNEDVYEDWCLKHAQIINNVDLVKVNSIEQVFNDLATFSSSNFYSNDTIDNSIEFDEIEEKIIESKTYYYKIKSGYKLIRFYKVSNNREIYSFDDFVLQDYWNQLAPKAVSYSAGVLEWFMQEFAKIDKERSKVPKSAIFNKLSFIFGDFLNAVGGSLNLVFEGSEKFGNGMGMITDNAKEGIQDAGDFLVSGSLNFSQGMKNILDNTTKNIKKKKEEKKEKKKEEKKSKELSQIKIEYLPNNIHLTLKALNEKEALNNNNNEYLSNDIDLVLDILSQEEKEKEIKKVIVLGTGIEYKEKKKENKEIAKLDIKTKYVEKSKTKKEKKNKKDINNFGLRYSGGGTMIIIEDDSEQKNNNEDNNQTGNQSPDKQDDEDGETSNNQGETGDQDENTQEQGEENNNQGNENQQSGQDNTGNQDEQNNEDNQNQEQGNDIVIPNYSVLEIDNDNNKYWLKENKYIIQSNVPESAQKIIFADLECDLSTQKCASSSAYFAFNSKENKFSLEYDFDFKCIFADLTETQNKLFSCLQENNADLSKIPQGIFDFYTKKINLIFKDDNNQISKRDLEFKIDYLKPRILLTKKYSSQASPNDYYIVRYSDNFMPGFLLYSKVSNLVWQNKNNNTNEWQDIENIDRIDYGLYKLNIGLEQEKVFRIKLIDNAKNEYYGEEIIISKPKAYPLISEVKPGLNSFIEIYNPSDNELNLNNYSIQYASSTESLLWHKIDLNNIVLPAYSYYSFNSINLANQNGVVAILDNQQSLSNASSSQSSLLFLDNNINILDWVDYGNKLTGKQGGSQFSLQEGQSIERKAFFDSTAQTLQKNGKQEKAGNAWDTTILGHNFFDFVVQDMPNQQGIEDKEKALY